MKKNQKLIWIVVAVVAIAGIAYWYFSSSNSSTQQISEDVGATGYPEPGQAGAVSELSPKCKAAFESWKKWITNSQAEEYEKIKTKAASSNISVAKQFENSWLWMYNRGSIEC